MEFGEQIKTLRTKNNLTQEQLAQKLNVTRQAISNWENNRNLPDLETLLVIAQLFHLSLDELILGGNNMNQMTEKLLKDSSETRKARFNFFSTLLGTVLLVLGLACLFIKGNSIEYVDASGILHENFYLIPVGVAFLFAGMVVFLIQGIQYLKK